MTTEEKIIEDNWDKFLEMYWCQKCNGCPDGHNSHWKTVITSPQWKKWKEYAEPKMLYDFPENEELGIMSEQHFQDFLEFTLQQHRKEVIEEVKEKIEKRKEIEIVKLENTKNLPDRYYHKGKIHEQKDIQELLDNLLK